MCKQCIHCKYCIHIDFFIVLLRQKYTKMFYFAIIFCNFTMSTNLKLEPLLNTGLFKWKSREAGPKWGTTGGTFFIGAPVEPPLDKMPVMSIYVKENQQDGLL